MESAVVSVTGRWEVVWAWQQIFSTWGADWARTAAEASAATVTVAANWPGTSSAGRIRAENATIKSVSTPKSWRSMMSSVATSTCDTESHFQWLTTCCVPYQNSSTFLQYIRVLLSFHPWDLCMLFLIILEHLSHFIPSSPPEIRCIVSKSWQ